MKNQSSLSTIITLFQSVEENFRNNKLELALSGVRSILADDPKNFYAIAIERRLKRVLDLQKKPSAASNATEYSHARMIAALEHVCHMAVQQLTKLSEQASVHDMSHQLREQALENKHQALLHRARQQFHIQEYERALQEAKRARIIRPDSAEADTLILEIKAHMAAPAINKKQQVRLEDAAKEKNAKTEQQRDLKSKIAIERPEIVTEKILSSISFADYHRTNADYAVCLRYIEQGLELDPSNEVLHQMKEEVEKAVTEKLSEKESSYQLV
jgi:tetratricopeptide (TPR) repeat protein